MFLGFFSTECNLKQNITQDVVEILMPFKKKKKVWFVYDLWMEFIS